MTVLLSLLIAGIVVVLDRLTKNLILASMAEGDSVTVIPGVLRWTYIENTGAAFGMLKDRRWVFLVFSVIMIAAVFGYIVWKYLLKKQPVEWAELIALSVIAGGGVGNMIDRVLRGSVTDFVDVICFPFWQFIFNVADMFVTCGCFLLIFTIVRSELHEARKRQAAASSDEEKDEADKPGKSEETEETEKPDDPDGDKG